MSETDRKTFALSTPIQDMDGTELQQLALRPPKARDLRVLDSVEGDIAGTLELIAKLSGVPIQNLDELDTRDLTPIMDWLGPFLPGGDTDGG